MKFHFSNLDHYDYVIIDHRPNDKTKSTPMRILIQDKETACFFKGGVTWESDNETAFDFETIHNAAQFCARHCLDSAQILLQCRKTGQEIILPVPYAVVA